MTIQTSLQLFTIKEQLDADLEGSLAAVAARGFAAVEPYDFVRRAAPLADALTAAGLTAPSGHAFLASQSFVNPDGSGTTVPVPSPAEVFAAAKVLGMTTVIDPYTEPARWTSIEQIEETARLLNEAAAVGAAVGVRVGYHNHAHELEAVFDGVTGLEVLAGLLDERVVLEVDLYWVARGGVDPVALLERLGSRVIAVHAKDGTLDPALANAYPPADQVPAGEGAVPLVEAIAAASALELAIVEFDHYDGDLFDAIERSRVYLDEKVAG
ncbi:sugar phosphate isomerase/epimerase [Microbacterium sp. TPD7012]|uniref:sugar phosphate isomerase/epimerase family protein n=1 Tax=Microbacterium sp. TPD7012 TaxID=2171975 RepID=UPI000D515B65|nr:sugar phosphate isomerase/epimerase [Microbacterium sp. TPD7012]PVE90981.1 sugar phosphate isomerase/epimerase [Microbacterium sp. TPD7012]